jgi:hypothetical protein
MLKLRANEKLCVEGSVAENGPARSVPALCACAAPTLVMLAMRLELEP